MGDLELPQEFLAVLPTDPYQQLDVARKITSMAITARVSNLEAEAQKMQKQLSERDSIIHTLENQISELEKSLQDAQDHLSVALDEQAKIRTEKEALASTVKKLNRDVAKLESFKKTLMMSLHDEDEQRKDDANETAGLESSVASLKLKKPYSDLSSRMTALQQEAEIATPREFEPQSDAEVPKPPNQKATNTRLTSEITPTGSPIPTSSTGSPLLISASSSPRRHSISSIHLPFPTSQPSSKRTTAPNSPPQAGTVPAPTSRVDGKEFFRQARTRLSYEQFSAFLSIVKELNAHHQTKEETLKKADEIFGAGNKDLYVAFEGLLSRHLH